MKNITMITYVLYKYQIFNERNINFKLEQKIMQSYTQIDCLVNNNRVRDRD
jgi:hypothetical protein